MLVEPDNRFASAALSVCLIGGLSDELESEVGVSHLLEHLLFKKTSKREAKEIAAAMDELGGEINAFTDLDSLCVYGTTTSRQFPELSGLLAEMLLEPQFGEEEIQVEREIVRQEILESQDSPGDVTYQALNRLLWPDSVFRFPVFGTLESIQRLQLAHLRARLSALLTAGRCIVAASGAVDFDAVCRFAESAFGALPQGVPYSLSSPLRSSGAAIEQQSVHQVYIALSQPWIPADSVDVAAGLVIATVIGGSLSSRLFQKLREEAGLAYEVSMSVEATSREANLVTTSVVERAHLEPALEIIFRELQDVRNNGITEIELERTRKLLRARHELDFDSAGNRLWSAIDHEIRSRSFNDLSYPAAVLERLEQLTLSDVRRAASEFLLCQPGVAVLGGDVKGLAIPKLLSDFSAAEKSAG